MKLFSYSRRPVEAGAYPLERLARRDGAGPAGAWPTAPRRGDRRQPGEQALSRAMGAYFALYEKMREGPLPVAQGQGDVTFDPVARANNLKGVCYFLDAAMVATSGIPDEAWRSVRNTDHRHAIVILTDFEREVAPGDPGAAWIQGTQQQRADLRAAELAVVLAGYIRTLGYPAKAHMVDATDVDLDLMAVAAGLARVRDGKALNPFAGERFGLAVVTTGFEIAHDQPLAPPTPGEVLATRGPGAWLGMGGVRAGWKRLRGDHRKMHMSRFPMEKIRRRSTPSTIVDEANVPRIPERANFFYRTGAGDLGEKAQAAWTANPMKFAAAAWKYPLAQSMMTLIGGLVPLQDGQTAPEKAPGTDNPAANADAIKAVSYYMGGDMVGICEAKPFMWYSHRRDGTKVDPYHKYVIAILIDQGHETMEGASGDDWISATQSMRGYMHGSHMAGVIANHIRSLGYGARTHTVVHEDILHIPAILYSGLGELSRIGELVLNPFVGPRFKSVMITTDMPLAVDRPIDFGLQDFCNKCMKCARECPCSAIPLGPKVMFNGYEMWKPDVEKCTRYRVTNPHGSMCGRCMKTCPYNIEGILAERLFLWMAIHWPWTRKWIAILDDKVGNGRINKVKKWWWDLEMVDGIAVKPKGVHERELNLDRDLDPEKQVMALYPRQRIPAFDATVHPIDRKQGVADYRSAEKAADARKRLHVEGVG